jgi:hypothetical protein
VVTAEINYYDTNSVTCVTRQNFCYPTVQEEKKADGDSSWDTLIDDNDGDCDDDDDTMALDFEEEDSD